MIKTLTQYPGVVHHLLTRTAHRPPPIPHKIDHKPITTPSNQRPHTHRQQVRSHLPRLTAPAPSRIRFATPTSHARIEWHPAAGQHHHHTLALTVIPLLFIAALAFISGCLAALLETSFSP